MWTPYQVLDQQVIWHSPSSLILGFSHHPQVAYTIQLPLCECEGCS